MTPIVPPAGSIPYKDPLNPRKTFWRNPPPEGDQHIPASVQWTTDGGAAQAISFNCENLLSGQQFNQIEALTVNNILSTVDINFLALDSGVLVTVPAGCSGTFPFFTRSKTFYAWTAQNAISTDRTTFAIHNSLPPPLFIGRSQLSTVIATAAISLTANGTTAIIPAALPIGTITALTCHVSRLQGGAALGGALVIIADGSANPLTQFTADAPPGAGTPMMQPYLAFNQSGLVERFAGGLNAVVTTFGTVLATGILFVTVAYRTP
jgi:hypothetical protein